MYDDAIYNPLITGAEALQELIIDVLAHAGATEPDNTLNDSWIISPYSPTPTIIEAARTLYENHSVEDITRHEADKVLTEALAIDNHKKCRASGEKKNISDSRREVGKFIQIIHRYRDNMLQKIKDPVENGVLEIDPAKALKHKGAGYGEVEHVAIFDEYLKSLGLTEL